jgi:hypothetical protein
VGHPAACGGSSRPCYFLPRREEKGICAGSFTTGLLAGIIFYGLGAQELVQNPWNLHIVDPALAGLATQGLLVAGATLARLGLSLTGRAALILIIVSLHGMEMTRLRLAYQEYARQGYELGKALKRNQSAI